MHASIPFFVHAGFAQPGGLEDLSWSAVRDEQAAREKFVDLKLPD
jgi:hypothetical protein